MLCLEAFYLDTFEAIRKRRTCRSFKTEPVPQEIIRKLLRAGQRAPTGGNANTRRFIVIDDLRKLRHGASLYKTTMLEPRLSARGTPG